jgi:hypothetical protein
MPFLLGADAKNRATEIRLALGAFIVCFLEWLFTPYTILISMVYTTFLNDDLERHYLIFMMYFAVYTVATPYALFITSPKVRKLFAHDWLSSGGDNTVSLA